MTLMLPNQYLRKIGSVNKMVKAKHPFEESDKGIHMPETVDTNSIFHMKAFYGFLIFIYMILGVLVIVG